MDFMIVDGPAGGGSVADETAAVDEFMRDVGSGLSDFVREAEILLSGASGLDVFEDGDEPPLADPEQRERVERMQRLLTVMQQSWWQNTKPAP